MPWNNFGMGDRLGNSSRVRTCEDKVCRKDLCWSMRAVYVLEKLSGVSEPSLEEAHDVTEQYQSQFSRFHERVCCSCAGVDAFRDQHTNALECAVRGGARCSASCVDRSDRLWRAVRQVAGENDEEPTNVSPGRPVGAGTRRVVLGSASHLERPQST